MNGQVVLCAAVFVTGLSLGGAAAWALATARFPGRHRRPLTIRTVLGPLTRADLTDLEFVMSRTHNRTTAGVLAAAILVVLGGVTAAAITPQLDRTSFRDQAGAELRDLALPATWGPVSVATSGISTRHPGITSRYAPGNDSAHAVDDVVSQAREQGWAVANCGSETCMSKGRYWLQVEPGPCEPPAPTCQVTVAITWTTPLFNWRLLIGVLVLAVFGFGMYAAMAGSRRRAAVTDQGEPIRSGVVPGPEHVHRSWDE